MSMVQAPVDGRAARGGRQARDERGIGELVVARAQALHDVRLYRAAQQACGRYYQTAESLKYGRWADEAQADLDQVEAEMWRRGVIP
jgi:hypothetical protein